jgi:predicted nucleic acid-binding protein
MKHVAVDSDIFFFSVSQDKRDRNVRLASSLLEHIDNHPDIELCVPFSVLAETVFKTTTTEKESRDARESQVLTDLGQTSSTSAMDLWLIPFKISFRARTTLSSLVLRS